VTASGTGEWKACSVSQIAGAGTALTQKKSPAASADFEGTEMTVDEYRVVVTQLGLSWQWELYRNGGPLPARLQDGPYKSARTAEAAGLVALREFLQALGREKKFRR
jgi:hypothetical protein